MEKLEFEWNPEKAAKNLRVHKISFDEAATVFSDPLSKTVYDPSHSLDEDRYITIGTSYRSRALMLAHTERNNRIRIISARELTSKERHDYETGNTF